MAALLIKSKTDTPIDINYQQFDLLCNEVQALGLTRRGTVLIKWHDLVVEAIGGDMYEGLRTELINEIL
jgi:hypothetical protein